MPILILSAILQVALVVHIIKTGRSTTWIWIVVMLPLAGSIAYLLLEVLPDLMAGRAGRRIQQNIQDVVNPAKSINNASQNYSMTDTVENALKLADECMKKGMFSEAKELYTKCRKGLHMHDPDIMHGLATAEFQLNNYSETKELLDKLILENPEFKNPYAHLLYTRALEKSGDTEQALKEYEVLDISFPGPEATYYYAILLKEKGNNEKAMYFFEKIVKTAKTSGKHYNSIYKKWISLAKNEYRI